MNERTNERMRENQHSVWVMQKSEKQQNCLSFNGIHFNFHRSVQNV